MRTFVLLALAAVVAVVLGLVARAEPFGERLVRLEAANALPEAAAELRDEPIGVNAVFLDYAGDPELILNARLALSRYPDLTREILPLYGLEPEFRDVLRQYGPAVMPPIAYFLDHDVRSLHLMKAAGEAMENARRVALRFWGDAPEEPDTVAEGADEELTDVDRGWYAVAFIREEGHDFLGQFIVTRDDGVEWVQTERITEGTSAFFTSGIRTLETQYRREADITAGDYLWAGVDLAVAAGSLKLLRAGRAAATGARAGATSARSALVARNVVRAGRAALRVGKYAVPVAVGYAVLRHPSLISGLGAQFAALAGWPAWLGQSLIWFIVIAPLVLLARFCTRWLVRPAVFCLHRTARGAVWLERRLAARGRAS